MRWIALEEGSPVALVREMGDGELLDALRSRNPDAAWAQQVEARGYREARAY